MKAAVANLLAVHMVRNPTFKGVHEKIRQEFRVNEVPGSPPCQRWRNVRGCSLDGNLVLAS